VIFGFKNVGIGLEGAGRNCLLHSSPHLVHLRTEFHHRNSLFIQEIHPGVAPTTFRKDSTCITKICPQRARVVHNNSGNHSIYYDIGTVHPFNKRDESKRIVMNIFILNNTSPL
jgi:hypothetical protein